MRFNSFSESILPQENIKLKTRAKLRDPYYIAPYEKLPYEVEWSLVRVLEQEIKNFRQVEMLRELLQTACDFDTIECFNAIDADKLGVIDLERYFAQRGRSSLTLPAAVSCLSAHRSSGPPQAALTPFLFSGM